MEVLQNLPEEGRPTEPGTQGRALHRTLRNFAVRAGLNHKGCRTFRRLVSFLFPAEIP